MVTDPHLLFWVPPDWTTDAKGDFYEEYILEILRPMRLRAERRLRVTGMELDIIARGEDRPRTILVECKAHRDPIAADTITKLLGNVQLRRADEGWLFSTSDLTKDGRGLWDEIQNDPEHSRTFTWYSPSRTIEVLKAQRSIVDPATLLHYVGKVDVGSWTLIVTPGRRSWFVEILQDGVPSQYAVFDARTGAPLATNEARDVAAVSPRYSGLRLIEVGPTPVTTIPTPTRAPVARVISGDAWEDPRPARPIDFVGRDEVLRDVASFIEQVRTDSTATRSFAVLAPSGWGKSSFTLKLAKQAETGKIASASVTAVDSRSAASPAFVAEALRLALRDSVGSSTTVRKGDPKVLSLREPLDSPEVAKAIDALRASKRVAVLIFDQFEELFAKEALFEVFHAVRDLSLDVDARQVPLILGFAWKTDVSLPQQHPAYHLWHQLADRRKTFKVGEFGRGEIERVVSRAETAIGKKLSRALRSRLAEQCQGLPWLLKKLLVHVLQRVTTPESQYLLLERELDVEQLFKEDLEQLKDEHLRCLKFVASRAPVPVAEVEEAFSRDTTNLLINQHLLVRSGMNYVVYWDIFRDYLIEERVPEIPWTRTFQRMPPIALKALEVLHAHSSMTAWSLSEQLRLKEGPTFNVLGDLVSLQLVEADGSGRYRVARHLTGVSPPTVAAAVRNQLRRHVVARAVERLWPKDQLVDYESWVRFFGEQQPRIQGFSEATLRQYSGNLKSWLVFAGLLEVRARGIARTDGQGAQMGQIAVGKQMGGLFMGTAAPAKLQSLLEKVFRGNGVYSREDLEKEGLRNAIVDGLALGLVNLGAGRFEIRSSAASERDLIAEAKSAVSRQPAVQLALQCLAKVPGDRKNAAALLANELGANWKPASAFRNLGGLLRYSQWTEQTETDDGAQSRLPLGHS